MFTETGYLFECLTEECAEIIQRVSKCQRFTPEEIQPGQTQTNTQRLAEEINDLLGVLVELRELNALPPVDDRQIEAKRAKLAKFMAYSRERGTLE